MVILIVGLLLSAVSNAQNSRIAYTVKSSDGLPSDVVFQTQTNDKGFLLVATQRGLSQYDGYRFFSSPVVLSNVGSLAISNGTAVFNDAKLGLCSIRNIFDKPAVIAPTNYYDSNPNNDHYENIYIDGENRIWCNDFNNVKYFTANHSDSGSFVINEHNKSIYKFVSFLEPEKGLLWMASSTGLYCWRKNNLSLSLHPDNKINKGNYTAATIINRELIALATADGRLIIYNILTSALQHEMVLPHKEVAGKIQCISENGKTVLLVATPKKLYSLDTALANQKEVYVSKNASVNNFQVDNKTNMIWLSTNAGLIKLSRADEAVSQLLLPVIDEEGMHPVTAITSDKNNLKWMAQHHNTVYSCDNQHNWKQYTLPDTEAGVQQLYPYANELLISTNKGLFTISNYNNRVSKKLLPGLKPDENIKQCVIKNNKELWILTAAAGVFAYDWPSLNKLPFSINNNPLFWKENVWNEIIVNTDGTVWLAGWMPKSYGIARYDSIKNQFTEIARNLSETKRAMLTGDYYNRVSVCSKNRLLFSGFGGWNMVDRNGDILAAVNTEKYAVSNHRVEGIAEDLSGKIWFATAEGLQVYNPATDKVIRISQLDGLPTDNLVYGFHKCPNDILALGINNGIALVDVKRVLQTKLINYFEISGIKINGKIEKYATGKIELNPDQKEVIIYFSSLSFTENQKTVYRYKFDDEKEWNYLGSLPQLSLLQPAPGNYHLTIEAGDNLENWQSKKLEIDILVHPPFYQTWWFKTLLALLLLTGSFLIYNYLLRQRKKEENYRRQINEAEMQTLRSQMNPHFMFNTLNSINSYIIQNKTNAASEYLTTFSKLMRNILENSRHATISLKKEIETLQFYLELECARLENAFDYTIKIDPEILTDSLKVPPLIIQPFAENAIWHGLHNKKSPGNLYIHISQIKEEIIKITVTDDGIGRAASAALKKEMIQHKSYGIEITTNRLKLLNDENTITIKDDHNIAGEAAGTTVEIIINTAI